MKKYLTLTIILTLTFFVSHAQLSNQILLNDQENLQKISKGGGGYYASNSISNEIEGTPFLFNLVKAKIVSKERTVYEIPLIYDTYRDVFIFDNRGVRVELNENRIDSIFIDNRKFISIEGGYYEIISDSNILFLKRHKAEILRPDYVPALNTGNKNRRWKINTSYFLKVDSLLSPISLTKSSILNVLKLNSDQLSDIQKKGYKFTKESDVVLILQNLNK